MMIDQWSEPPPIGFCHPLGPARLSENLLNHQRVDVNERYYNLAGDMRAKLGKLQYLAQYSLLKTMSSQHQCRLSKTKSKLSRGNELIYRHKKGEHNQAIKVFQLKHMEKVPQYVEDEIPNTTFLTATSTLLHKN